MIRRGHTLVFLPAFLLLLLAGMMHWLLHTTPGARFLFARMTALLSGEFTVQDIRGDLGSGLDLLGFTYGGSAVSVTAGTIHAQIAFDLLPPAVAIESLRVDQVLIRSSSGDTEEKSAAEILAGLGSPLPLHFELLEVGRLSIRDDSWERAFEATDLRISALWKDQLELAEVVLQAGGVQFKAAGKLDFASPFAINATIYSWLQPSAEGGIPAPGIHLEASLNGNFDNLAVRARLDRPDLALEGHGRALLTAPDWDLHIKSDVLQWPLGDLANADETGVAWRQLTANITGSVIQYELDAQGILEVRGNSGPGALGDLVVQATGGLDGLQLEHLSLSGDLAKLNARGPVSWSDGLQIELASQLERLDPSRWIVDWPADHPVHGALDAKWQQGRLTVPKLDLQAGVSNFRVAGGLVFDPGQNILNADLSWQSLQWPVAAAQATVRSESGQLNVSGKLEDWTVAGSVQLQGGNWPRGDLRLNGHGDRESVRLQIERSEILGGQVEGQASYRWVDQRPWSANLTAKDLDATALAGGYPLVISGTVMATGMAETNSLSLDMQKLTGYAHGQPVEARGKITFETGLIRAKELRIQSGSSHLALNGSVLDADGIRFSGEIESLGAFIDQAAGRIAGEGRISLDPVSPVIELNLQGNELAWADWRLAAFSAGPLASELEGYEDPFALRMDFTGLAVGDKSIDGISITSHGLLPLEHTKIEARRNGTRLDASISGSLQDWQALDSARWSGLLESLRLSNDEIGYLELEQAARFVLDHGTAQVEPACFRGSRNGRWCADVNWVDMNQKDRGHLVANARLDQVSLNLIRFFVGTELKFTQTLNGTLHWEKLPGSTPVASVQISVSEGQIVAADESAAVQTGPGLFGFVIENGNLSAGNMDMTIPEAGTIDVDFSAPDISLGADSPLQGRVQFGFSSIEPFMSWVDTLDQAEAVINADIQLAGTIALPSLTGHASLVRGRIEHFATGLVLSDIQLAGAVFQDNRTELNGSFVAGEGRGQIVAAVTFDKILKPQATVKISGQDLTLISVPDMTIKIDPDLDLQWQDGRLQLNGSVRIPLARISPRYLPTASADESADLVIVAGQLPPAEKGLFDRSRLRINGSVAVELGKDVTLTLDKAKARFQGKTIFNWNNKLIPTGDGSYSVTGKIVAYGQSLQVSEGKISFPRVPANNPRLNIRAEREIYGNVQVKQAGVLISGTLKRPQLETYTRPATTQERALALLVTGHDFDYEQGVGAVEVGIYIAPKLYVSYGIGLFESDSVISVRYDLGRGFGVKATSSQRQSGGDMTYTIER